MGIDEVGVGVPPNQISGCGFEPAVAGQGEEKAAEGAVERGKSAGSEPVLELVDGNGVRKDDETEQPIFGVLKSRDLREFDAGGSLIRKDRCALAVR